MERDVADLGSVQTPVLRRLLLLLAASPGAEIVHERLAQQLSVSRATVSRYLDLLESLYLIYRLPAWSRNLTKRQVGVQRAISLTRDWPLRCLGWMLHTLPPYRALAISAR